jgi:hypothetical protein
MKSNDDSVYGSDYDGDGEGNDADVAMVAILV